MVNFIRISAAAMLWVSGLVFFYFTGQIFIDEILPAIRNGTLSVATRSTILNHVWVGNEIYLLLLIYLLVATSLLLGGARLLRNTLHRPVYLLKEKGHMTSVGGKRPGAEQ